MEKDLIDLEEIYDMDGDLVSVINILIYDTEGDVYMSL